MTKNNNSNLLSKETPLLYSQIHQTIIHTALLKELGNGHQKKKRHIYIYIFWRASLFKSPTSAQTKRRVHNTYIYIYNIYIYIYIQKLQLKKILQQTTTRGMNKGKKRKENHILYGPYIQNHVYTKKNHPAKKKNSFFFSILFSLQKK